MSEQQIGVTTCLIIIQYKWREEIEKILRSKGAELVLFKLYEISHGQFTKVKIEKEDYSELHEKQKKAVLEEAHWKSQKEVMKK